MALTVPLATMTPGFLSPSCAPSTMAATPPSTKEKPARRGDVAPARRLNALGTSIKASKSRKPFVLHGMFRQCSLPSLIRLHDSLLYESNALAKPPLVRLQRTAAFGETEGLPERLEWGRKAAIRMRKCGRLQGNNPAR